MIVSAWTGPLRRATDARARLRRRETWLLIAMVALAALPSVVATARAIGVGWVPVGDDALIAGRAYDVFSSHSPLVGHYSASSRVVDESIYSLGPLLYWLLAVPARIGPAAMLLTIGAVHVACVAGAVLLARRRGGNLLMIATAVAIPIMSRSLHAHVWADIWDPAAALLPFLLLVLVTWSIACGELRLLPLAVLLASFVVHCHLAYVIPTVALLATAFVGAVMARRRGQLEGGRRAVVVALAVGLLCWSAPIVDQLVHEPGNLRAVAHAAGNTGPTLGAEAGWNEVAGAVGVPPYWLRAPLTPLDLVSELSRGHGAARSGSAVVVLALLAALAVAAARRRRHDVATACAQTLVLCAALAAVAAEVPTGQSLALTANYALWWASIVGMWAYLVAGWSLVQLAPPLARLAEGRPARALAAAGVLAALVAVATARRGGEVLEPRYEPVRALGGQLGRLAREGGAVRIDTSGRFSFAKYDFQTALAYGLRKRGARVLAPSLRLALGSWYADEGVEPATLIRIGDAGRAPARAERTLARVPVTVTLPTGTQRSLVVITAERLAR